MPLLPGANIGANIKELSEHGSIPRPHKQIVAIALNEARKTGVKVPKFKQNARSGPRAPSAPMPDRYQGLTPRPKKFDYGGG